MQLFANSVQIIITMIYLLLALYYHFDNLPCWTALGIPQCHLSSRCNPALDDIVLASPQGCTPWRRGRQSMPPLYSN